mmetsp:Transcript_59748/g.122589  ORF Transcript_59748/g.122589 Transcript_59748/m.122589 type:complete len:270 (+) Transcript_59748:596-1405(+)
MAATNDTAQHCYGPFWFQWWLLQGHWFYSFASKFFIRRHHDHDKSLFPTGTSSDGVCKISLNRTSSSREKGGRRIRVGEVAVGFIRGCHPAQRKRGESKVAQGASSHQAFSFLTSSSSSGVKSLGMLNRCLISSGVLHCLMYSATVLHVKSSKSLTSRKLAAKIKLKRTSSSTSTYFLSQASLSSCETPVLSNSWCFARYSSTFSKIFALQLLSMRGTGSGCSSLPSSGSGKSSSICFTTVERIATSQGTGKVCLSGERRITIRPEDMM